MPQTTPGAPDSATITPEAIAAGMDGLLRAEGPGVQGATLPSPRVQNHAAFLARDAGGTLHCLWFGGALEGKADICIHGAALAPGAAGWGPAVALSDDPDRSEQNPVLFLAPDGRRLLLHTAQPGGNQDQCVVRLRDLDRPDDVRDLPLPRGTFVRGGVMVRADGAWLLPLFHCVPRAGARWTGRHDTASLAISADAGESWRLVPVPGSLGCVHMSLVDLGGGHLAAFFRRRQADFVYRTESRDGGESWSVPAPTDVPNNNSSIGVTRLADGRVAMVCNPANAAMHPDRRASLYDELGEDDRPEADGGCAAIWGVPRAPLALVLSTDGGVTFPDRRLVMAGPGSCLSNDSLDGRNRELSYPVIAEAPDGTLDIAFSFHRRAIRHMRVRPDMLEPLP